MRVCVGFIRAIVFKVEMGTMRATLNVASLCLHSRLHPISPTILGFHIKSLLSPCELPHYEPSPGWLPHSVQLCYWAVSCTADYRICELLNGYVFVHICELPNRYCSFSLVLAVWQCTLGNLSQPEPCLLLHRGIGHARGC